MTKKIRLEYDDGVILQGDCLVHMKRMEERKEKVDLVFGSPPYEDARLYLEDGRDLGIARNTEDWVAWMIEVFRASLGICKGLVAFVVGHGKGARNWSAGPVLLMADMKRQGFVLRRPVIYRRNGIMGSGTTDWLRADHEWIICATNTKDELPWSDNTACGHTPKWLPGGVPSYREKDGKRVVKSNCPGDINDRDVTRRIKDYVVPPISNPGDIIDCSVGGGKLGSKISHDNEAPFPEKLPNFFIRSFCPPGGVVYDPFGGSGTTAAVAIKTGRKFICSDLRRSQIDLMERRVREARTKKGFGL